MSRFSDLDLKFIPHPYSGRVKNLDAKSAIFRSLNHLLMVRNGEKLYDESFGIGIQDQLFELQDFISMDSLKTDISDQIKNYETRITLQDVILTEDRNNLTITIEFYLNSNPQELITFERTLLRIR